ncbi:MAG TPA: hypothetical protein VFG31_07460 [Conexibacter sp.]|nr:hypothetical protein [Conexibacter sp.]
MGEVVSEGTTRGVVSVRESVRLDAVAVAWLAAVPCAAITALAVLVLGPPASRVLFPPPHLVFLPGETVTPEPLENARYLLALAGPVLLAATVLWASRRQIVVPRLWARIGVAAAQLALVALVVACLVTQHEERWGYSYFNWTTLAAAGMLTAAFVLAIRSAQVRDWLRTALRDTPRRRLVLLGVAALVTALWLLPAVNSEASIRWAFLDHDTEFHFDETFAVLNGLTPLANFNAQYASLLPYLIALSMRTFEPTLLVFTITACTLSVLVLLSVYGVLRRAAGNAPVAFALFLPFMATSLFYIGGLLLIRFTPGVYFPMFPLRYGGAYLLAWLVARHLDRGDRRTWPIFLVAGFAVLNNFEFGVAAFGATIGALLVSAVPLSRQRLLNLAGAAAAGAAGAVAFYSIVTLARAGTLPQLWRLAQFARLYGAAGFSVAPIPAVIGLPLVLFGTHAAAIATATVRRVRSEPNRVLTGMLMWAGLFGLGSATYYVARSSASILPMLFSAWALSLTLLAVVVLRRMVERPARMPGTASLAVLFGVGLLTCSLAQAPVPWQQIRRVREKPATIALMPARWTPPSSDPAIRRFVSSLADGPGRFAVRHGAPVAIFTTMGHRLADAYGIVNVLPYTGPESIHTREQLDDTLDALRDAGGNTALVPTEHVRRLREELLRRGFAVLTQNGLRRPARNELPHGTIVVEELTKWVDTHHLSAGALG